MGYVQAVDKNDLYNAPITKSFKMIENYIYLYHTDTLIALPLYPESIDDTMSVEFSSQTPLSRSAPIYSYSTSGPRSMQIQLPLHRDMMNQINIADSRLNIDDLSEGDYVDVMIKQLQAAALPRYGAAEKMVNPPIVAIRFGNSIFCKGVVTGQISVSQTGPILEYNGEEKYALVTVSFNLSEVDPYDADSVMLQGGYRGLSTTLEKRIWKNK